jgi:hypothetical protein
LELLSGTGQNFHPLWAVLKDHLVSHSFSRIDIVSCEVFVHLILPSHSVQMVVLPLLKMKFNFS